MSLTYPSRLVLGAAMSSCPCGYHCDSQRRCACAPQVVQRYLSRVSGPLLDRLDLHVEVPAVHYRDLADRREGEPSEAIRERVSRARETQPARFAGRAEIHANAHMTARDLHEYCRVGEGSDALLRTAIMKLGLSARAYHRVLKIARTVADLAGSAVVETAHVSEANPVTCARPSAQGVRAGPTVGGAHGPRSQSNPERFHRTNEQVVALERCAVVDAQGRTAWRRVWG